MHIEEDTCKSVHGREGTLLNFNRAGVPLIEIVSKPEIKSEKEAVLYLEAIREILLYLGISDVKIEEGSMRCDANVSVSKTDELGTKTEIKNIGSITNVATSIKYEINRQTALLEKGEKIIEETRRFDDKTGQTISMRVKETGNDYRYFPEPDIPFVHISDEWINSIKIPPLPNDLRIKYSKHDISENNIKTLISNYDLTMFLESIYERVNPVLAINLLTGDILSYLNKNNISINETKLTNLEFVD
jgi:aspartyl-tRNA(Asn)/glutamyl-tRNA(Gln) amidotransferase subunit B